MNTVHAATETATHARCQVMGILNVTPDSFSDGGKFTSVEQSLQRAREMLAEGADIIDVGGESTRPGASPVSQEQEIARVVPVVSGLQQMAAENNLPPFRLSIDTRRAEVAVAAIKAGATIINDVSSSLSPVAADHGVGWIAVHMKGEPSSMQDDPHYDDVVAEVTEALVAHAEEARRGGVSEVWVDPGFGFGKTLEHNLQLMAHIDTLVATGWPVAIGTSRKTMLGQLIAKSDGVTEPVSTSERLDGSVTTGTYAMLQGVQLIRVHDVKAAKQAATVVAGHP